MATQYSTPVDRFLTYGDCRAFREWPDYLALGFTREHVPELIRMALDPDLHWADSDSPKVWAPVHAWRTLGQLRATEAIEPLLRIFHEIDDSDWVSDDLPKVYGMIGPSAIPALVRYLADNTHGLYPRASAAHSLERIGNNHPGAYQDCVVALTDLLAGYKKNDPAFNAFIICDLLDLHAVESLDMIREAYAHDCVELSIVGDVEYVEIALGIREERSMPARHPRLDRVLPHLDPSAMPFIREAPKVGRNDLCPCGSGKKYKKCCINKYESEQK